VKAVSGLDGLHLELANDDAYAADTTRGYQAKRKLSSDA